MSIYISAFLKTTKKNCFFAVNHSTHTYTHIHTHTIVLTGCKCFAYVVITIVLKDYI